MVGRLMSDFLKKFPLKTIGWVILVKSCIKTCNKKWSFINQLDQIFESDGAWRDDFCRSFFAWNWST